MGTPLNTRTQFITLVKREFLEHRTIFLSWPLLGTAILVLIYIYLFVDAALSGSIPAPFDYSLRALPAHSRDMVPNSMFVVPFGMVMTCYWFAMLFYFLTALQQQRKNRSVLFWSSMPVSDAQTVLSKLVAGLLCCHVVYVACYLVLAFFLLLTWLAYGAYVADAGWDQVAQAQLPTLLATILLGMPLNILWTLPVYGWCLLVSARVRNMPFLWAAGPILLLFLAEVGLLATGRLVTARTSSVVVEAVIHHAMPLTVLDVSPIAGDISLTISTYPWPELLGGALLGALFVFAAIRVNRADDA
jgi:ABC-2 type transport system permease protein